MGFVAVVASNVGEGGQGASVGAGRAEMRVVWAEKIVVFEGVQFEEGSEPGGAVAWSQASSVNAAGAQSPVESGSFGVLEAGVGSHFVDEAAVGQGMPDGTGGASQVSAVGAYIHVGSLSGPGEEDEGQEDPLDLLGTPEARAAQCAGGTAVAEVASAAVVGAQDPALASLVGV